ncbi:MAG: lipopolysaccharide biosynthesis protein [Saprospiraceae bacterium]
MLNLTRKGNLLNETSALQMMLVFRQLSVILLAILFSKFYSIEEIGQVEGLQFILATFSVFWLNGILQWFLPTYQTSEMELRANLLWRVFGLLLLFSTVLIGSILFFKPVVFSFFLHQKPYSSTEPFLVYSLFILPSYFLEYVLFVKQKYSAILLISSFSLFFQNAALFLGDDLYVVFAFWALLAFVRFAYLFKELLPFSKLLRWNFRPILVVAGPLIIYTFIAQWAVAYDSWLVNFFYKGDPFYFAVFRYGARELPLVLALASGLSAAMSSKIAENFKEGLGLLKVKSKRLIHFLFPFTIILLLGSNTWFPLVFSEALSESVLIFDIFLLLIISRLLFPQAIALAKGEQKAMMLISIVELLVNMLASFYLAGIYGLPGIAVGTLLAFTLEKILIAVWLYKKFGLVPGEYTPVKSFLIYSILLIAVFSVKYTFFIY